MERGDHIYVHYTAFTHHGIFCGEDVVIHYTKELKIITRTCLQNFANVMVLIVSGNG